MRLSPFARLLALVALTLWLAVPAAAQTGTPAACAGRDLIAAMTPAERAPLDAAVAGDPYATGNWWRATLDDSVIDIVGTFHIDDPRHIPVADRLRPVVAAADGVWLEATEAEMKALQADIARDPGLVIITDGPTLPELLSPEDWQTLSEQVAARGIPPFMASKFRPWYLMAILGLPPCAVAAAATAPKGLDQRIMDLAAAADVPTYALEPHDTVFKIFDIMSAAEQLDMVRTMLPMADQAEDMFATLTGAYFRGEHRLIWEFTRAAMFATPGIDRAKAEADFAQMEEVLLNARNRGWIDVILPAAEGRRIVVAAGAAHLSGPEGLLPLLAAAGYKLTRVDG
jgi:hypothetical protein